MPRASFSAVAGALIASSGGTYSLAEAAELLSITTQQLHRQIQDGEVLGMELDGHIVVPKLQFTHGRVLPGIDQLTRIFTDAKAGPWMKLQFLADQDHLVAAVGGLGRFG